MSRAIIIPIHSPHIARAAALVHSAHASGRFDQGETPRIVFVCSDADELNRLSICLASIAKLDWIQLIDAESYAYKALGSKAIVYIMRENLNRCIINVKKFIGLHWAMQNGIDWSVVIDVDAVFSRTANFGSIMDAAERNYRSGLILGKKIDKANLYWAVNEMSLAMLDEADMMKLREQEVSDIFSWFMVPPTYPSDDVRSFFAYMEKRFGTVEDFFIRLNWHTFDNVLYNQFRAAVLGVPVVGYDCAEIDLVPERLTLPMIDWLGARYGFRPVWLPYRSVLAEPLSATLKFPDVGLYSHIDRI